MRPTQPSDLPLGHAIDTADGTKLGEVKEVAENAFKVNASMELDYWLPLSAVAEILDDRIVLGFDREQLGVYKMAGPDDIAGTAAAER